MNRGRRNLELFQGEASSSFDFCVVLEGLATADRAQEPADRSRSDRGCFLLSERSPALLLAGLVEPGSHAPLPLLAQVLVRQLIVMFQHHRCGSALIALTVSLFLKATQSTTTFSLSCVRP